MVTKCHTLSLGRNTCNLKVTIDIGRRPPSKPPSSGVTWYLVPSNRGNENFNLKVTIDIGEIAQPVEIVGELPNVRLPRTAVRGSKRDYFIYIYIFCIRVWAR